MMDVYHISWQGVLIYLALFAGIVIYAVRHGYWGDK